MNVVFGNFIKRDVNHYPILHFAILGNYLQSDDTTSTAFLLTSVIGQNRIFSSIQRRHVLYCTSNTF